MAGGVNYTLYYNVLNYFKTIMSNHPSINFVSQGDVFSVDTKEFPQYPVGNVLITDAVFNEKTTDYTVQIIVADKTKLKNNESSGSFNVLTNEFEGVDDTVDIHANTLSVINDIINWTQRKEEGFEINGAVNCTAFKERFDNGLAGWTANFTLTVHNDKDICLFFLTNPTRTGYLIENCLTSEQYYATLSEPRVDNTTGSFQSTWPTDDTCYSIVEDVSNFDKWDLLNVPVTLWFEDCAACAFGPIIDASTVLFLDSTDSSSYVSGSDVWYDLSSQGNDASASLIASYFTSSLQYFDFPGDDYTKIATVPYDTSLNVFDGDFTVQAVVTIDNTGRPISFEDLAVPVAMDEYSDNPGWAFSIIRNALDANYGKVSWYSNAVGQVINGTIGSPLTLGEWYVIQLVKVGNNITLYSNKVNKASASINPSMNNTNPIVIGRGRNNPFSDYQWDGKIASIAVYSKALSETERERNYDYFASQLGF